MTHPTPLVPAPFAALPLGSIEPRDWLRDQMRLQADGLTGRLEELWPDVGPDSGWLGGSGESWERGPYYLDGLVPLAHQLGDEALIAKSRKWIEWTLASQREDGFFGPASNDDWWPRMVMAKVLVQVHEATGDARIPPFLDRWFRYQLARLEEQPLAMWAASRGAENAALVLDRYERTGDPELLRLAELLRKQTTDWTSLYLDFPFPGPTGRYLNGPLFRTALRVRALAERLAGPLGFTPGARPRTAARIRKANAARYLRLHQLTHGVNHAMALKAPATFHRLTDDPRDLAASARGLEALFAHHGTDAGAFTSDEHLDGTDPTKGIELCTVVELMRSLEELVRRTGDGRYGDRLEKAAFNALPAACTDDVSAHQYFQQVNQVLVTKAPRAWFNASRDANLFGLAPHFGCCAANLHQGWPKFCASLFAGTADGGLAAVAYAPCRVRATAGEGTRVGIEVATGYPFHGTVDVAVSLPEGRSERFPLRLRIPAWAAGWSVHVNGEPFDGAGPVRNGFATLDRAWRDGDRVRLEFPMEARTVAHPDGSVAVERGPLLFALRVAETWLPAPGRSAGGVARPDLEVVPASPWNYALRPDRFEVVERPIDAVPFSHAHPAVEIRASGARIPSWRIRRNSAGPLPLGRALEAASDPAALEPVVLVPYGSTALRIARFPRIPPTPRTPGNSRDRSCV